MTTTLVILKRQWCQIFHMKYKILKSQCYLEETKFFMCIVFRNDSMVESGKLFLKHPVSQCCFFLRFVLFTSGEKRKHAQRSR